MGRVSTPSVELISQAPESNYPRSLPISSRHAVANSVAHRSIAAFFHQDVFSILAHLRWTALCTSVSASVVYKSLHCSATEYPVPYSYRSPRIHRGRVADEQTMNSGGGETPRIGGSNSQAWLGSFLRTDSSSPSSSIVHSNSPSPVFVNNRGSMTDQPLVVKASVPVALQRTSSNSNSWALRPFHATAMEQFVLDPAGGGSSQANSPTPREHTARRARDIASLKQSRLVSLHLSEQPALRDSSAGADPAQVLKAIHAKLAGASLPSLPNAVLPQSARNSSQSGAVMCSACGQQHVWCACTSASTAEENTVDLDQRPCLASAACRACGQQCVWCTCNLVVAKTDGAATKSIGTYIPQSEPLVHYLNDTTQQRARGVTRQEGTKVVPAVMRQQITESLAASPVPLLLGIEIAKQSPLSERTNGNQNRALTKTKSNSAKQPLRKAHGTGKQIARRAATNPSKPQGASCQTFSRKTLQLR